jgi:peptidyl-tRNA hydrolase, PTH2 family
MNRLLMSVLGYVPMPILRHVMKKYDGQLRQKIVLRTDLKMRRGKEISQGAHASMGVVLKHRRNPFVRMWLDGAFAKIAVGIESEEALLALHQEAKSAGLPSYLIQDAGRTEFDNVPTYTAVAVGPGDPEVVEPLTKDFNLR